MILALPPLDDFPLTLDQILMGRLADSLDEAADEMDGAKIKTIAPAIGLLDWMKLYRPMLSQDRPFDLVEHKYLIGIYSDEHPECVYKKAGQMGISEMLLSRGVWSADQRNANVLYVFPTDRNVSEFSAARLGPAIENEVSPYLSSIVVGARSQSGGRGADRVSLKRVRNRFIYFRGGQVKPDGKAPQLKSVDADVVFIDERDEHDNRTPSIARKRLDNSDIKEFISASTPTYKGVGIDAEFEESDKRLFFLRCDHCGERQPLTLESLILDWDKLERPLAWNGKDSGNPFCACRRCHKALDRLGDGEWVAEHPSRAVHGYHIVGLLSQKKSLAAIIDDLHSTNETKRKEAFNQGLGYTYKSPQSLSLNDAVLKACVRDYGFMRAWQLIDEQTKRTVGYAEVFAGIDVGAVLHIVIRAKLPNGDRPLLYAGYVGGFDEAEKVLKDHKVKNAVIDGLPETHAVRKFQSAFPRNSIWLAYYDQAGVDKTDAPYIWDAKKLIVHMDRTRSMDKTMEMFYEAAAGRPGNTLPANIESVQDYLKQLKSPERKVITNERGEQRAVYIESNDDHFFHSDNYQSAAMACPYAMGWTRGSG